MNKDLEYIIKSCGPITFEQTKDGWYSISYLSKDGRESIETIQLQTGIETIRSLVENEKSKECSPKSI